MIPIKLSETVLFEPFFSFSRSDTNGRSRESRTVGIGIFRRNNGVVFDIYYGIRISSVSRESFFDSATGNVYSLVFAPEYPISKHFTISGEAILSYGVFKVKESFDERQQREQRELSTGSNIILRWYF